MTDGQDRELMQRIAGGDELALRALFAGHATGTFRYVLRLVESEAVAEEVTNGAFLEPWRHAGDYRGAPGDDPGYGAGVIDPAAALSSLSDRMALPAE